MKPNSASGCGARAGRSVAPDGSGFSQPLRARSSELTATSVKGRVVGHKRGKKIRVFNYHRKTGWKKTRGHRSELTRVEITVIT